MCKKGHKSVRINCDDEGGLPASVGDFRVYGLEFRVQGSGFRVPSSGFRVQGFGFGVQWAWVCCVAVKELVAIKKKPDYLRTR